MCSRSPRWPASTSWSPSTCSPARKGRPSRTENRTGEAGRAAVALRELAALVDEHLDSGFLEAASRLRIAVHGQGDPRRKRQEVGSHRVELFVRDRDDLDASLFEELRQPDR